MEDKVMLLEQLKLANECIKQYIKYVFPTAINDKYFLRDYEDEYYNVELTKEQYDYIKELKGEYK